ncbi:MAG: hypothetical protein IPK66_12140 [Rhodospirillales bacterium]|nr:hypothetical protein [Rhodospirillales bacterium]
MTGGTDPALHLHKRHNLFAHAPEQLHKEVSADYTDMISPETAKEIEDRRKVDGWQTLATTPTTAVVDLAA